MKVIFRHKIILGPDRIHIQVISGYPNNCHRDGYRFGKKYRDKNWSGSYSYLKMKNERKFYEVIFVTIWF